MGQKANLLTLRNSYLNFAYYKKNSSEFLDTYIFLQAIEKLFLVKSVFLALATLSFSQNKVYIKFCFFYRTALLVGYKKKLSRSMRETSGSDVKRTHLFFKTLINYQPNTLVFQFSILNRLLKKKKNMLFAFYTKLKKKGLPLFPRRYNFFFDFIKISVLFFINRVSCSFFIKILGDIFRGLRKKRHTHCLAFFKDFFSYLLSNPKTTTKNCRVSVSAPIIGIKLVINGKIKGKARSSSTCIMKGQIPTQSLGSTVNFSKTSVFTLYGSFGLKLWVCRG